ncbi:MAG: hypothetical protein RL322_2129 [Pseudomonadota bacterium]|jgi:hypothetical protein
MNPLTFGIKLLAACSLVLTAPLHAAPFSFIALGDMPYGPDETAGRSYRALIEQVNRRAPVFSIHVGDFKSGSTLCSNDDFTRQRKHFDLFDHPVVYTPGDNEWTDCHRKNNGSYDPIERLTRLREQFFYVDRSLGKRSMPVESQRTAMPLHGLYIENQRWVHGGSVFITAHIVGSNNNFEARDPKAVAEFFERDRANIDWIKDAFRVAREQAAQSVIIAIQADVLVGSNPANPFGSTSGFKASIGDTLLPLARDFGRPVLLIHGDSHILQYDEPFRIGREPVKNLRRLQVPGASDVRAVRITVDPSSNEPFTIQLIRP